MLKFFYNLFKHPKVKRCPFCGAIPEYDQKSELVHCPTLDCAIHSWFIHIEEWNKRK